MARIDLSFPYHFEPWTTSGKASGTQALRHTPVAAGINLTSSQLHLFLFISSSFLSSFLLVIHVHSFFSSFFVISCLVVRPANSNGATPFLSPPSPLQACCRLLSESRLRVVTFCPGVLLPSVDSPFDDNTVYNIPSSHSLRSGSSSSQLSSLSVDIRRYAAQTRDAPHYLTPYRFCAAPPVRHFDSHRQRDPFGFF